MQNGSILDDLGKRLAQTAANSPIADMEKNLRVVLQSTLTRLNLVSREEFDVQTQVLARSREQIAALESRLAELESRLPSEQAEETPAETP